MQLSEFKRIVTSFADREADIDIAKGELLVQVREELISAKLSMAGGELTVEEDDQRLPAARWLINRVARLPLLADRIISYIPDAPDFVTPSGQLLDQPNFEQDAAVATQPDAVQSAAEVLGRRPAGTTSVLYLTSDAGEGKTTLINHLARHQAAKFKAKRSDWLLVPIPLGGRAFLRFDDVVVAALVNRLRFQLLYYEAFLELVRLGVIVPAFDGFEEMIIGSSSGEAVSALGNLVKALDSSGTVLIAARKAYFDYHSLKAQAKLFDAVGVGSVAFARLGLDRWSHDQFLAYASKRGLEHPQETYDAVANRLRPDHPLLTRAVLVRRVIDVAQEPHGLKLLLDRIGQTPQHFFFQFVTALVEREAHEKWIDLSGDPHQPLLTVDEHHELLAMVAQEMWLSATDTLRLDVVDAIAEVFAEGLGKPPALARQVKNRLRQHSLLVSSGGASPVLSFDHEDFRSFYLGEALGLALCKKANHDLRALCQVGLIPSAAVEEAALCVRRHGADGHESVLLLQSIADVESGTAVAKENCGALAIEFADEAADVRLSGMTFPEDSLRSRTIEGLTVRESYFHATSLAGSCLKRCVFENCHFERLELANETELDCTFENCDVTTILRIERDEQIFDPALIRSVLEMYGVKVASVQAVLPLPERSELDEELRLLERALRVFLRSSHVNEEVIRTKLGVKGPAFFDDVLPQLLRAGIFETVQYLGHGSQRRFRLRTKMERIHESLSHCGGDFEKFLALAQARNDQVN